MRKLPLALLMVLAACGSHNVLQTGQIVEKLYDDPDTWYSDECISHDPKTYACVIWMPVRQTDAAHYWLRIEGEHEGRQVRELHETDRATYLASEVGERWEAGSVRH